MADAPTSTRRERTPAKATNDTPGERKDAEAEAGVERAPSRYVVGEVVPTTDGIWIRLIDTVPAAGRHAAVKAVVGTREGRWFVCAEGNSEILTYGPPPDPTPTLVASQSVSTVLAEPTPEPSPAQLGLGVDPQGAGEHTGTIGGLPEGYERAEGQALPLSLSLRPDLAAAQPDLPIADDQPPAVDERLAREGQMIPIDPDAA